MGPLPAWLEPLPDAGQQRALDEWAMRERGLDGGELMERAGAGAARLLHEQVPVGPVCVVCGKGNNGGDGLVAARWLREHGREVRVLLSVPGGELRGDARRNLQALDGEPPQPFTADALRGSTAILDALLGTGSAGAPRGLAREAIGAINAARADGAGVVACDVPSGVDASTGEVASEAVRAHLTATFHAGKPGLWIAPGKGHAGEVRKIPIGIPDGGPVEPATGLILPGVRAQVPARNAASTKFAAGSVLVCGGSTGLTGAPSLSAEAAMRAGAGYVTVCVPASLQIIFALRLLEVMSLGLPDRDGALRPEGVEEVLERAERADALVLGPGLGREPSAQEFARALASRAEVPLLLDADGLNAHAGRLGELAERRGPTVLTPHAGELGRLLGADGEAIAARRLAHAREAAERSRAIVVLKGDDTIVAAPDGRAGVSSGAAPALATAGAGDVLSGVIGAFLAKGMEPFAAACAGVFVHTEAGRRLGRERGVEGVLAGDVVAALPGALRSGPV